MAVLGCCNNQGGTVFLGNGKVLGMDAFGKAVTFSIVFKNLVESYALDAVDRFEKEADAGIGGKGASGLLAASSTAMVEPRPSLCLGWICALSWKSWWVLPRSMKAESSTYTYSRTRESARSTPPIGW
jgi:hypothetical protein